MIGVAAALSLACMSPDIVDGDTLWCDGEKVRLKAIDAAEFAGCRRKRCTNGSPSTARQALIVLTAGRLVKCESRWRDAYGRPVAICRVGTLNLGCAMIAAGHAEAWPRYGRCDRFDAPPAAR